MPFIHWEGIWERRGRGYSLDLVLVPPVPQGIIYLEAWSSACCYGGGALEGGWVLIMAKASFLWALTPGRVSSCCRTQLLPERASLYKRLILARLLPLSGVLSRQVQAVRGTPSIMTLSIMRPSPRTKPRVPTDLRISVPKTVNILFFIKHFTSEILFYSNGKCT